MQWLFAHPTGWFFVVIGAWCGGMLLVVFVSNLLRKKPPPEEPD